MNLVDTARERAETLLLANGSDLGLVGSNEAYRQVWARDSMLCSLGLLVTNNPEGRDIHRRSLQTLRAYQSPLGKIPHNVGVAKIPDPALVAHGGRLEANAEGCLCFTLSPTPVPVRRARVAAELRFGDKYLGQQTEALVTVVSNPKTSNLKKTSPSAGRGE